MACRTHPTATRTTILEVIPTVDTEALADIPMGGDMAAGSMAAGSMAAGSMAAGHLLPVVGHPLLEGTRTAVGLHMVRIPTVHTASPPAAR